MHPSGWVDSLTKRFNNGNIVLVIVILAFGFAALTQYGPPQVGGGGLKLLDFTRHMSAGLTLGVGLAVAALSSRSPLRDSLFEGITNIYQSRTLFAKLLMFASLLYFASLLIYPLMSSSVNFRQVYDSGQGLLFLGLSLALSFVLAIVSAPGNTIGFQRRQQAYYFSGLAFLLFFALQISSFFDLFRPSSGLRVISIVAVAIGTVIYLIDLLRRFTPFSNYYKYTLSEVDKISAEITELVASPATDKHIDFIPGQHSWVKIKSPNLPPERHPFVFASADNGPYVRFSVRALGDYTSAVSGAQPGSKVSLEGPYGGFNIGSAKQPSQVWIGGDIGIVPFLSMARGFVEGQDKSAVIVYVVSDPSRAIFYHEFSEIEALTHSNLRVVPIIESEDGVVDSGMFQTFTPDIKSTDFFICGPSSMIASHKNILRSLGVSRKHIQTQSFKL